MRKPVQYFFKTYGYINEVGTGAYSDSVHGGDGEINSTLHCLCDDGTVWWLQEIKHYEKESTFEWTKLDLPEIPQGD